MSDWQHCSFTCDVNPKKDKTVSNVYTYVIIHHPENGPETIHTPPTTILASSNEQAKILASRKLSEDEMKNLSDYDILVRPF